MERAFTVTFLVRVVSYCSYSFTHPYNLLSSSSSSSAFRLSFYPARSSQATIQRRVISSPSLQIWSCYYYCFFIPLFFLNKIASEGSEPGWPLFLPLQPQIIHLGKANGKGMVTFSLTNDKVVKKLRSTMRTVRKWQSWGLLSRCEISSRERTAPLFLMDQDKRALQHFKIIFAHFAETNPSAQTIRRQE